MMSDVGERVRRPGTRSETILDWDNLPVEDVGILTSG